MITDVAGVRAGHWTDAAGGTGCTAVLFPDGTVASGEVRGGAPATREWALLAPERLVARLDAVVLAGGSAFGLAAADGVVRFCEERGMGFPTAAGPVPIVVGLALYDLAVGDPGARPGPAQGYAACEAATAGPVPTGPVGAGTGATVGAWWGPERRRPGGIGTATERAGPLVVAALLAVNAAGDVDPGDGSDGSWPLPAPGRPPFAAGPPQATTIGVVATNGALDKVGCLVVAQGAHDGLARALVPAHARGDGDAVVAAATGEVAGADVDVVRLLATRAVVAAVRAAVPPPGGALRHRQ
ncbi:MAG TPA: P1 family peptidase [Acidimicrobiales bacterium]